jgi:hypothetical protein
MKIKIKFGKEFNDDLNISEELGEYMQCVWDLLERASGKRVIDGYGEPAPFLTLDTDILITRRYYFGLKKKGFTELINLINKYRIKNSNAQH